MQTDEQLRGIRDECRDLGFAYAVFVDLRRFTELAAQAEQAVVDRRAHQWTSR
jgi:hypothetical protein